MVAYLAMSLLFVLAAGLVVAGVIQHEYYWREIRGLIARYAEERAELLDRIQAPEQQAWKVAAQMMPEGPTAEEIDRMVEEQFQKLPVSLVEYDEDLLD